MQALRDLLKPERLTAIVDIGGADKEGLPPYQRMLDEDVCTAKAFAADDIRGIATAGPCDFLKMTGDFGIQRLNVGPHKVAAHVGTAFFPTYTFGAVDTAMRGMGFVLHCFSDCYIFPIVAPVQVPNPDPHQIAQADVLYVRDFMGKMEVEQWKHLALLAHHVAGSHDLAMLVVSRLAKMEAVPADACTQYLRLLERQ